MAVTAVLCRGKEKKIQCDHILVEDLISETGPARRVGKILCSQQQGLDLTDSAVKRASKNLSTLHNTSRML